MQNDIFEFDSMVKSMLSEAEEEVPSQVWSTLESRMRRTRTALLWRRVAVAASVAAAIGVAAFLGLRQDGNNSDFQNIETVAFADNPQEDGRCGDENPALETVKTVRPEMLIAEALAVKDAVRPAADAPEMAAVPEEAATAAAEEVVVVSGPEEEECALPQENGKYAEETGSAEAFARMEWEDSRRPSGRRRISLTAGGDMQTNGHPGSVAQSAHWLASSHDSPAKTTVTQTSTNSTYSIPMSFGLKVRFDLDRGGKWSLGTGVTYSLMERTFTGVYQEAEDGVVINTYNSDIHNTLHYIGIPVSLYYDIISGSRVNFYAFAGGSVEKLIFNKYRVAGYPGVKSYGDTSDKLQYSVAAGIGVQFKVNDFFGLYLDPSIRYYFDNGQPVSIRTQQPLMMSFEVGARFNF